MVSSSSSSNSINAGKRVALGDITVVTLRAEAAAASVAGRRKRALPRQQQQQPAFLVEMELEGGTGAASPSSCPLKKPRKPLQEPASRRVITLGPKRQEGTLTCEETTNTPIGISSAAATAFTGCRERPRSSSSSSSSTTTTTTTTTTTDASNSKALLPPGVVDVDDPEDLDLAAAWRSSSSAFSSCFSASSASVPASHPHERLGAAYSKDYSAYLKEREASVRDLPHADYLSSVQGGAVTQDMRAMLVDWLVTVAGECELMPSTLYHTVCLVDRALSAFACAKDRLQCLGSACLLIASKFEETAPPSPREIRYAAADSFSAQELVDMEMRVAEALGFRVAAVTPYHFLPRFLLAAGARGREALLTHYCSELTLLHAEFLAFPPSLRAAAALLLARASLAAQQPDPRRRALEEASVWTPTLAHYTGYALSELLACVRLLRRAHQASEWSAYPALRLKYSCSQALHVAEQVSSLEEAQLEAVLALSPSPSSATQ